MSQHSNGYYLSAISCNSSPASDFEGSGHLSSQTMPLDAASSTPAMTMGSESPLTESKKAERQKVNFEASFLMNALDDELAKCFGQSDMAGLKALESHRPGIGNEQIGEQFEEAEEYVDITPLPLSGALSSPYSVVTEEKIDPARLTHSPSGSGSAYGSEKDKHLNKTDGSLLSGGVALREPEDDYEVMLPFGQGTEPRIAHSPSSKQALSGWRQEFSASDSQQSSLNNSRTSFTEESSRSGQRTDDDPRTHDYADPDYVANVQTGRELLAIRPEDYEDGVNNEMGYSPGVQPPSSMQQLARATCDSPSASKSYRRLRHLSDKRTGTAIITKTPDFIRRKSETDMVLQSTASDSEKKKKRPAYVFISQTLGRPNRRNKSRQSSPETSSLKNFPVGLPSRSRGVSLSISRTQSPSPPSSQESSPVLSPELRLKKLREKRMRRHTTSLTGNSPTQTRPKFTLFSLNENTGKTNRGGSTPPDKSSTQSAKKSDPQQTTYETEKELLEALMKSTLV